MSLGVSNNQLAPSTPRDQSVSRRDNTSNKTSLIKGAMMASIPFGWSRKGSIYRYAQPQLSRRNSFAEHTQAVVNAADSQSLRGICHSVQYMFAPHTSPCAWIVRNDRVIRGRISETTSANRGVSIELQEKHSDPNGQDLAIATAARATQEDPSAYKDLTLALSFSSLPADDISHSCPEATELEEIDAKSAIPHVLAENSVVGNLPPISGSAIAERNRAHRMAHRLPEESDSSDRTEADSIAQRAYVNRNEAGGFFAKWTVNCLISAVRAEAAGKTFIALAQRVTARCLDCFSWGLNMNRLNTIFGENANEAARLLNRRIAS